MVLIFKPTNIVFFGERAKLGEKVGGDVEDMACGLGQNGLRGAGGIKQESRMAGCYPAVWYRLPGLNRGPCDYESHALTS